MKKKKDMLKVTSGLAGKKGMVPTLTIKKTSKEDNTDIIGPGIPKSGQIIYQ